MPKRAWLTPALLCWLGACASALWVGACASAPRAPSPRELPSDAAQRDDVVAGFGRSLYGAVAGDRLEAFVANDRTRDGLLKPEAANRPGRSLVAGKVGPDAALAPSARALWGSAQYAGLCIQSGRLEPPSGALGLKHAGFVFERGLLIGREPGGGELAGWVEGLFVLTDAGFVALEIARVEAPRRDHSDLELAECELADHPDPPQDVVPAVSATH